MQRKSIARIALSIAALTFAAAFFARAADKPSSTMAETARRFLASLDDGQKAKADLPFDSDERLNWHYIPKERLGLAFSSMNRAQSYLAHALISTGLSDKGRIKAATIMSLEQVLRDIEGKDGNAKAIATRDPDNYHVTVFGEPSETKTWGWRLEGHHVSLNYTLVDGDKAVVSCPSFFGANPHEVKDGPRAGLCPLAEEEDLGFDLLNSLDPARLKIAVIGDKSPEDIFTRAERKAVIEGPPQGIPVQWMSPEQRQKVEKLLRVYLDNMPDELARRRSDRIWPKSPDALGPYFAWIGARQKGEGHYYRIQGEKFLVEFDNTQNNANHSHAVWRDFEGDFGLDLLAEHYKAAHAQPTN